MANKRILASLDLGTNSTLFLIAEVDSSGKIRPLYHDVRTNDLGRGLGSDGFLAEETIELNVKLLGDFVRIAREAGAAPIRAAATEALRKAKNAEALLERVHDELSLRIKVITGQQEAALTFRGILSGLPDPDAEVIAADIGGGSSEVIHGRGGEILFSTSIPVGAISLDKRFIKNDPILPEELAAITDEAKASMTTLPDHLKGIEGVLVVCGGTASSLAAADLGLREYKPERISCHEITRKRILEFILEFSKLSLDDRRKIPGIGYRRAEIILPGAILIRSILEYLGRDRYMTSERGLRYGLLVNSGNAHDFA
jgi:exopolyphosphatase/guanosine-5'-triphosphate,3'-diphosphate pyrophosphatase